MRSFDCDKWVWQSTSAWIVTGLKNYKEFWQNIKIFLSMQRFCNPLGPWCQSGRVSFYVHYIWKSCHATIAYKYLLTLVPLTKTRALNSIFNWQKAHLLFCSKSSVHALLNLFTLYISFSCKNRHFINHRKLSIHQPSNFVELDVVEYKLAI